LPDIGRSALAPLCRRNASSTVAPGPVDGFDNRPGRCTIVRMRMTHIPSLAWQEARSPSGRFHSQFKNISAALGARWRDQPGESHPFDLQLRRVPAGAAICPYHSHTAQWEMFVVLRGRGTARVNGTRYSIEAGDAFIHAPGTAHQTINTGSEDLELYIIADNPTAEICFYPDSNKWGISPLRKYFRIAELDYFDGEGESIAPPPAPDAAPFSGPVPTTPLRKIRIDDVAWETWESPKRKFRGASRELSIALGAVRNAPLEAGGHPFDLELGKFPPGHAGCPFHSHAAQWELFVIVSGKGAVRAGDTRHEVVAGDAFVHPPGEAHQLINTGDEDLVYYLVADNPPVDYWHYPDSGKWGLRAPRHFFRIGEVDYYDGEE
jgi:uncharacterized cupin superfamily protein